MTEKAVRIDFLKVIKKNKVILRSDRHGNSEEMLRETKYE